MATKVRGIKLPVPILQLHIELRHMNPKVWRRVLVPQTITLSKLHLVIQAAFGWEHSHLHEFVANDAQRYGTTDPMYGEPPEGIVSEKIRLTTALRTTKTMNYVYDFGDYWEHRIKLEKTLAPIAGMTLPFCIGGAGAAPPEDCGGVPGYGNFVQAMADPNHPEHADMVEWFGCDDWDPAAFDSIPVNDRLDSIKV